MNNNYLEDFRNKQYKRNHFKKHKDEYKNQNILTPSEYEEYANKLAKTPIDDTDIIGFVGNKRNLGNIIEDSGEVIYKYNTLTGDMVIYSINDDGEPLIFSLFKTDESYFNNLLVDVYIRGLNRDEY